MLLLAVVLFGFASGAAAEDEVARARALAAEQKRSEALSLLSKRLAEDPADTDARTLSGIVLSWDRRFDDARRELQMVLNQYPGHEEALMALINMELWAGNPLEAEQLARGAVERHPSSKEFREVLRKAHSQAEFISSPKWETGVERSNIWFSDGMGSWRETQFSFSGETGAGALRFRASQAEREELVDRIYELEMYPRLGHHMHGYLSAGYSPGGSLYARYRMGAELFRGLPKAFEASFGMRHYQFVEPVNLLTGSIGKYYGNWLFTARPFIDVSHLNASHSVQLNARRFLNRRNSHWDLRMGWGASPVEVRSINEIGVLNSLAFFQELNWAMRSGLQFRVSGGIARQQRQARGPLWQYALSGTLLYGF
jgi:YaiO family outer membrane protein